MTSVHANADCVTFKFTIRPRSFQWVVPNSNGARQLKIVDGKDLHEVPLVSRALCWVWSHGWTSHAIDFEIDKETGNRSASVNYTPMRMTKDPQPPSQDGNKLPSAIKIAFYTEIPQSKVLMDKSAPGFINTYRGGEKQYSPLGITAIDIRELFSGSSLKKYDVRHNHTPHIFSFSVTDAELHYKDGSTGASDFTRVVRPGGEGLEDVMRTCFQASCATPEHVTETSDDQLRNAKHVGDVFNQISEKRELSIGEMLENPVTASPFPKECLPFKDMENYFRYGSQGAICPALATYFLFQSFNLKTIQPFMDEDQPATSQKWLPWRVLPTLQLKQLLHSALTIPNLSNELNPYTSDVTCAPVLNSFDTFQFDKTTFRAQDFALTECQSRPMCQMKVSDDCEGGAATAVYYAECLKASYAPAWEALKQYAKNPSDYSSLETWMRTCNADTEAIPKQQWASYAVQTAVVAGMLYHEAAAAHVVTVGAQCATPLEKQTKARVQEGGHCCALLSFNGQNVNQTAELIYKSAAQLFNDDKVDQGVHPIVQKQASVQIGDTKPLESLFATLNMRPSTSLDLSNTLTHYIMESTSHVNPNDVPGAAKLSNLFVESLQHCANPVARNARDQIEKHPGKCVNCAKALNILSVNLFDNCVSDPVNLRASNFLDGNAASDAPNFYHVFYCLGNLALMQVEQNNSLTSGCVMTYKRGVRATDFLFHADKALITVEPIPMPLLDKKGVKLLYEKLHAQWDETMLPSRGSAEVERDLYGYFKAGPVPRHTPSDPEKGIRHIVASLSGSDGAKLIRESASGQNPLGKTPHVAGGELHEFAMGNSTVVRVKVVDTAQLFRT
jgi:hypothetical protein